MKHTFYFFLALFFAGLIACQTGDNRHTSHQDDSMKQYGQEFHGKIAKSYEDSEEWWPSSPKPPEGTPNVIIYLLDDTGFESVGPWGKSLFRVS